MNLQINDIFEDDMDILEIIDFGFPRLMYIRSNYFHEMDDYNFFKRFRITKRTSLYILRQIEEMIEFPFNINNCVSPMNQLLTTLRFYATATHLTAVADFSGMHNSTASRIISRVSCAIAMLRPQYVKMPNNPEEIQIVQNDFYGIAAFPRVLGAIDCTHIRIQSPGGEDAEVYRNRKGFFSFNIQVVVNANLEAMDIVARWPGSTHDATIFNSSRIRARMENGEFPNCILLGDSGYPLRDYFLTPLAECRTRPEELYNEAHIRSRNAVERFFGNWKRRFPVLAYGLRLKISTVMEVIVATAVLQNISRTTMAEEDVAILPDDINENDLNAQIEAGHIENAIVGNNGINQLRANLINNYFNNL